MQDIVFHFEIENTAVSKYIKINAFSLKTFFNFLWNSFFKNCALYRAMTRLPSNNMTCFKYGNIYNLVLNSSLNSSDFKQKIVWQIEN